MTSITKALEHLKRAEWQVDRLAGDYRGVNWDAVCGLLLGEVRQAIAALEAPVPVEREGVARIIDPAIFEGAHTGPDCWCSRCQTRRAVYAKADAILSRLPPSEEWQPIETAPHACHVLATWFGECEWIIDVVMSPPSKPYTHWRPLPPSPEGV